LQTAEQIHLLKGQTERARDSFRRCLATGVENFTEYSLARHELARLKKLRPASDGQRLP